MTHLIALLLVASISPQEALKRSHAASKREAKEICERIEKELGEKFDGGSFSTTFDAKLPFTASYVRGHFEDHWNIEWNNWNPNLDPYFWQMDKREPDSVLIFDHLDEDDNKIYVRGKRWKMDLKPKPGAAAQ